MVVVVVVGECLRRRGFDLCLITFIIPNDDDDDVADDDDRNRHRNMSIVVDFHPNNIYDS